MSKKIFFIAKIISFIGFIVLLGLIIYGVVARDIFVEGSIMLSVFWGQFTFVDIYVAFFVFYMWVVIRERSFWKAALWFFLIMLGGSMAICLYIFIALCTSDNRLSVLMLGERGNDD